MPVDPTPEKDKNPVYGTGGSTNYNALWISRAPFDLYTVWQMPSNKIMISVRIRRYIECVVLIAVWMACGFIFKLGGFGYLLLGVPLVVVFQLFVVRRPLQQVWVREAQSFRLTVRILAVAAALVLVPVATLFFHLRPYLVFFPVIALGALPCAFALSRQRLDKMSHAIPSFCVAVIVGCFAMWGAYGRSAGFALNKLPVFLADTGCLTLVGFVVEEVAFRGAIDSHVSSVENTRFEGWMSAIFVSLLWGLWHLPLKFLYPSRDLGSIFWAIFINILWGVPLSFCWRKSGTLLLPSSVHALADALRNIYIT